MAMTGTNMQASEDAVPEREMGGTNQREVLITDIFREVENADD
jgi:hypothetical protein